MAQPPPHKSRRAVFPPRALHESSLPPSSLGTPSGPSRRRTPDEARALSPEMVQQVPNPGPWSAPPLTAAMAPLTEGTPGTVEDLASAGSVPVDAAIGPTPGRTVPRPTAAETHQRIRELPRGVGFWENPSLRRLRLTPAHPCGLHP
jgi:hypothetical protein